MAIIMTATPLHMHLVNNFTLFQTSIVIQFHVIGMFLPSLFSGDLVKKFGNTNIKNLNLFNLRACIGYIPQDGYLFSGSIKENIGFASNIIDKKSIIEAAKKAEIE